MSLELEYSSTYIQSFNIENKTFNSVGIFSSKAAEKTGLKSHLLSCKLIKELCIKVT